MIVSPRLLETIRLDINTISTPLLSNRITAPLSDRHVVSHIPEESPHTLSPHPAIKHIASSSPALAEEDDLDDRQSPSPGWDWWSTGVSIEPTYIHPI
jgi:hypothetical protein